jgi:hypothetical protein
MRQHPRMKVTHDTTELLVLDHVPWGLAVLLMLPLLLFTFAAIGIFAAGDWAGAAGAVPGAVLFAMALVVFVERLQLILDRRTGTVTLRCRTLWRYRQDTYALASLARARVESKRGSKGKRLYRPVLVFDAGEDRGVWPVTEIYSSGQGADRTAAAINRWLGLPPG